MQNGPKTGTNTHRSRPAGSYPGRQKQWTVRPAQSESKGSQNAQRNYERYLALARAEALAGDIIGAENYYQHAEHYFRSMSADRETT